jgi:glucose-6-phosphate 1-dehydrogenase
LASSKDRSTPAKQLPDFDLVLFGGTGDLAMRKLLPALFRRYLAGQFPARARIVGVARSNIERDDYLAQVEDSSKKYLPADLMRCAGPRSAAASTTCASTPPMHPTIRSWRPSWRKSGRGAGVLSVDRAGAVPDHLPEPGRGRAGDARGRAWCWRSRWAGPRLGRQHQSERRCDLSGTQIYRIDHYLGKEAVQNLLALRFGNSCSSRCGAAAGSSRADHRGRGARCRGARRVLRPDRRAARHGAEPSAAAAVHHGDGAAGIESPDAVRDEKLKVLRALRPLEGADVDANVVRGQYRAGAVNGAPVVGYLEEQGIPPDSTTETFVALKAHIDTWRWAGVPFYLRTGKRLQEQIAEIVIHFEDVPHSIFERVAGGRQPAGHLAAAARFDHADHLAKNPGETMRLRPVDLRLDMARASRRRSSMPMSGC